MLARVPNILTTSRIFLIPVIGILLYLDTRFTDTIAFFFYFLACLSDYFDGHLARKLSVISELGKFLDPIADKLLVSIVILILTAIDRIDGINLIPAVVILAREFAISGLREFIASTKNKLEKNSFTVTYLAKVKTTIQMFSLGFLIINNVVESVPSIQIGLIMLWVSAVLTIFTGYEYMKTGFKLMVKADDDVSKS